MAKKRSWGGKREGAGRKPGYESTQRKTGYPTRVARIPQHWDVMDIDEGLEQLDAILKNAEAEIKASASKSANSKSNDQFLKLVNKLRGAFPRTW